VLNYEVTNFNKSTCKNSTTYTAQTAVITDKLNNTTGDEEYRASTVCEHTLNLQFCDQLVYAFQKFDLKEGDYVDIYNQTAISTSSRDLIAHYDIDNAPSVGEVFNYNTTLFNMGGSPISRFIIRFASDNKVQGTGFELTYYGIQTGIEDFDNVEINIYPNPATSYVNVQVDAADAQQFSAKVVDMMGKTVYVEQFEHNGGTSMYQIPVNNLAKGVYFLHLNNSNGNTVKKFVVE